MTKEQVRALNNLIETCIMNGGDAGGPYMSCQKECIKSIEDFLNAMDVAFYDVRKDKWDWPYVEA